jgi:DNA topoisomerase-2
MKKSIHQEYQVLDEIEHIRKRTGMYAGSVAEQTSTEWVYDVESKKMVKREISYIPALVKIFSEILDNAIDESRRAPDVLDSIRVTFENDGSICILDNGRGIPVEIHEQTGKYVAETIFTNLRAGSNFNDEDDQQLIGTNGVGSTITSVLSTHFKVESCDGKKVFKQDFWNGMRDRSEPVIKADTKNRTKITFTPDYEFFKITGLTEGNRLRMMKKVVDAAACNLNVKFYLNGDRIMVRDFDDYIALYATEFVTDSTPDWHVGISESEGFEQISFVNSVETFQGGSHIDYVMIQITDKLREFIKKKHKLEIKPAEIRNHMRVYISANVNRPKFSSQTKENMISSVKDYKTSWEVPDKMINKIVKSSIIQSILDWADAKAKQEEIKELRKLNKEAAKTNPKHVEKFTDAVEKRDRHLCEIYFAEGDSARNSIQSARGKNTLIGSYSLRGKPLNIHEASIADILANRELAAILTITGLQIGEKVRTITDLRFGKFVLMTDQDLDGFHIRSLLMGFFARFWPELYEMGVIHHFNTPLYMTVQAKGVVNEFFTQEEYDKWAKTAPKHKADYYKGLGGFDTSDFKRFLENREQYLTKVTGLKKEDIARLELAFSGEMADDRKEWLSEINYWSVDE